MDVDLRVRARRKLVQRATLARRGQGPAVALVSGCRDLGEQATPRSASCGSAAAAAPRLHRPLPRLPPPFAHRLLSDALQVAAASWVTAVDGRTQTGTWERKEPMDLNLKSTAHRHDVMADRENPRSCAMTFTRARAWRVSAQWNFLPEEKEGLGEWKPAWANEALAAGRGARDPACLKNVVG
ncbi:uncharacterized protein LOC124789676 [Schistocerca piceifrons]|uniref:uncharacterized protein LOC124789676 n=1 Tax=Schistocerca piceifrons TaxID=274613 RepID=UPI001F5E5CBA|nr:uncharacterized protein LOC124789676 [Schistocerca piceifrons]